MTCWIACVPSQNAYHSSILSSVFVNEASHAFVAKTKSNQSQGQEAKLLKVLHSCLLSKLDYANSVSFLN